MMVVKKKEGYVAGVSTVWCKFIADCTNIIKVLHVAKRTIIESPVTLMFL